MSNRLGIDPDKFQHISSDDKKTILRHKDGHQLTIAHNVLSPKMRQQLQALSKAPIETQTKDQVGEAKSKYGKVIVKDEFAKGGKVPRYAEKGIVEGSDAPVEPESEALPAAAPAAEIPTSNVDFGNWDVKGTPPPEQKRVDPNAVLAGTAPKQLDTNITQPQPDVSRQPAGIKEAAPETPPENKPPQEPAPAASSSPRPLTEAEHVQRDKKHMQDEIQMYEHDINAGHITPKTYADLFGKKDTLGKIGTFFGLLLSGAGSGLSHQPNAVLAMMNQEINNDLDAQKQSVANKQNFLRINQNALATQAQANLSQQEAELKKYTLSKMMMNSTALHHLTEQVKKLPVGSKERQDAENVLAMMNSSVQNDNYNLMDRAAAASQYYRMVLGDQGSLEVPAVQIRKKQLVGAITPQQSEAALKEIGQVENHVKLNKNALDSFDKVAKMATFAYHAANPIQAQRRIDADWAPMVDKLTKDTEGRVTPITIDLMNSLKPKLFDDKATLADKRNKLNAILTGGLATPTLDSIGVRIDKGEPSGINPINQAQINYARQNASNPDPQVQARVQFIKNKFGIK